MQNRSCQKFRFLFVDCETQTGHEPRHILLTASIWKRRTGHTNTNRRGGRVFMHPGETRQTHRGRRTRSVTLPFSVKEIPHLPSPSSSQHLWHPAASSVRNLRGSPRHALFGLWTPEFSSQIKRSLLRHFPVSWTTGELLPSRVVMSWGSAGEGRVSAAMWGEFFFFFFYISWELAEETEVCSPAICLQHVHIFQSRWFEVLWALILVALV